MAAYPLICRPNVARNENIGKSTSEYQLASQITCLDTFFANYLFEDELKQVGRAQPYCTVSHRLPCTPDVYVIFAESMASRYLATKHISKKVMTEKLWLPETAVPVQIKKLLQSPTPINSMLAFVQMVRLLKTQPRTGWVDRGIPLLQTESIADHMYRMSIISMAVPAQNINKDKCVKIALIHDIAEALVGDITPFGGVTKAEKHRRELETIDFMAEVVKPYNPSFATEMKELWLDYEEIRCLEARYVKDIDKYEMIQQAWDYEQEHGLTYDLSEFYDSRKAIVTNEIGDLCDEVIRQRTEYLAQLRKTSA